MRLLLATSNPGKVREFRRLLAGVPVTIVTSADLHLAIDVAEDGETYAQNAAKKAIAFARAGSCWALADDSGIEVDALDGRPGLRSARYGTPDLGDEGRTALLLSEMAIAPDGQRTARYRAVVALASPTGTVRLFDGSWEGRIGLEPRGVRGFGYDPVFVLEDGRTAAELQHEEKDRVSHRGIAVRAAATHLRNVAATCG